MIENFNILLLAGGRYTCTPGWNRDADDWDNCYKMYIPVSGSARIRLNGSWEEIEAGRIYIFSGYRLERYECSDEMDVFWVHFMPQSLQMRYKLERSDLLHTWPFSGFPLGPDGLELIPHLFDNPSSDAPSLRADHPDPDTCRLQSILLYYLSDILEKMDSGDHTELDEQYRRLEPSVDFMNAHYLESPPLSLVAKQSSLCPNYFHRVFKKTFNVTPQLYMTRRRLDDARQLLSTTSHPIKHIAERVGYDNEFYFSRTFKKHIGITPSQFRSSARRA